MSYLESRIAHFIYLTFIYIHIYILAVKFNPCFSTLLVCSGMFFLVQKDSLLFP